MKLNEDYKKAVSKVVDNMLDELENSVTQVREAHQAMIDRDWCPGSVTKFNVATNRVKNLTTDLCNILHNVVYYYEEETDE